LGVEYAVSAPRHQDPSQRSSMLTEEVGSASARVQVAGHSKMVVGASSWSV
jgi:hypothetical protein